jgi:hypothetical protein
MEPELEGRDVVAEADAILAQQRIKLQRTRALAGQTEIVHSLETRTERTRGAMVRLGEVQRRHAERNAELDPDLRGEVLEERRAEIRRETMEAADALHRELLTEREAARAEAAVFEPRRLRRRACFDTDPAKDAGIRSTWIARLARMSGDGLLDFAEEALAHGNVALAGALEEEFETRAGAMLSGTATEKEQAAAIRAALNGVEIPVLGRAQKALAEVERAERECAERIRILRGGRPSGRHSIAEGLREHAAQSAG